VSFPLFNRPGTVVFVDDDADYLEMLALVLPRQWHAKLFLRPQECIAHLQQEPPFWEADAWNQQQLVDQWRAGRPLVPQILQYWRATPSATPWPACAWSTTPCPAWTVCRRWPSWATGRVRGVLLTGQADDQLAIDAFNRGLIQQFVPKQMPDIARHLTDVVQRLLAAPHPRHAQTWRAHAATGTPRAPARAVRSPTAHREAETAKAHRG